MGVLTERDRSRWIECRPIVIGRALRDVTFHLSAPADAPAGQSAGPVSFPAHVELLQRFLTHRADIVERIQGLLNAQRRPHEHLQDVPLLSRHLEDCFFTHPGLPHSLSRLRGQLDAAYRASGFKPREIPGLHNGLIDPAEMMVRGFHLWQQTRWPGRNGRVAYAQTLFNLYIIRWLELLSMRLWDAGANGAGDRLSQMQAVLDQLRTTTPADQPVFVRDARWLIQLAQSPATDDLDVYFDVATKVTESFSEDDRHEIHSAGVRMAGGHLRSQIHYYAVKRAVTFDEKSLVRSTRNSNALDFALLIQDLVPLLDAYEQAVHNGDAKTRRALADAICQGISPDPELFVNRCDVLGAYSMIEQLFLTTDDDGQMVYSATGRRHVHLFSDYEDRIGRLAEPLLADCLHFRPMAGTYSPYGVLYGFSSDLLEHMALKTLATDAVTAFGFEDVFVGDDATGEKLAWVSGWRKLPHVAAEVARRFDYPQQFAEDVFTRVERALRERVSDGGATAIARSGRIFIVPADDPEANAQTSFVPDLPARFVRSSDAQIVAAHNAEFCDATRLASERREGKCVLSYATPGGWVAITKDIFTDLIAEGQDVRIVGLPAAAATTLRLMCPGLCVAGSPAPTAS